MNSSNDVLIIAEIGGNHEGDFQYALQLLELAAGSGADVVKFQIYTGDSLVNKKQDPSRVAHFDRFALTTDQYVELAEKCSEYNVEFNASIWDPRQLDIFDKYMSFYKIGSGDLTAYSLLEKITEKNKPIMLSTGLATLQDIKGAVSFICECNSNYKQRDMLSILQCTSMYPIPDADANLNVLHTLKKEFNYPFGYSDHTEGTYAAEVAVAMGASILELHFTDEKLDRDFRDHKVSFTKEDIRNLRNKIQQIKTLQGSGEKQPAPSEIESEHHISFRRAIYPARNILRGEKVSKTDFISLRPCNGISAEKIEDLEGLVAKKDIAELDVIAMSDFEEK